MQPDITDAQRAVRLARTSECTEKATGFFPEMGNEEAGLPESGNLPLIPGFCLHFRRLCISNYVNSFCMMIFCFSDLI